MDEQETPSAYQKVFRLLNDVAGKIVGRIGTWVFNRFLMDEEAWISLAEEIAQGISEVIVEELQNAVLKVRDLLIRVVNGEFFDEQETTIAIPSNDADDASIEGSGEGEDSIRKGVKHIKVVR